MTDVFLSYSRKDKQRAAQLVEKLGSDFNLWWDTRLKPGAAFVQEINQRLSQAKCVLVLWSPNAKASPWVNAEALKAFESSRLVQVGLDGALPDVPFNIIQLAAFNATPTEEEIADLKIAIREAMAKYGSAGIAAVVPQTEENEPASDFTEVAPAPPVAAQVAPTEQAALAARTEAVAGMDHQKYAEVFMGFSMKKAMTAALLLAAGVGSMLAVMFIPAPEIVTQGGLIASAAVSGAGLLLIAQIAAQLFKGDK